MTKYFKELPRHSSPKHHWFWQLLQGVVYSSTHPKNMTFPSLVYYASRSLTVLYFFVVKITFGVQICISLGLTAEPPYPNTPSYYSIGFSVFPLECTSLLKQQPHACITPEQSLHVSLLASLWAHRAITNITFFSKKHHIAFSVSSHSITNKLTSPEKNHQVWITKLQIQART